MTNFTNQTRPGLSYYLSRQFQVPLQEAMRYHLHTPVSSLVYFAHLDLIAM